MPTRDRHDPAEAAARIERLLRGEPYTRHLDLRLVEAGEGRAVLEMAITAELSNDKGICHGGALFTLADVAFGAAALHGTPVVTVSSDFHFIRPGHVGEVVRATAVLVSRTRRTGLYQVSITDGAGAVIAAGLFKGQWLPDERGA